MPKIFCYGDSHSILYSHMPNVVEHWLGFNTKLPVTMFRMGREGLDIMEAPKVVGNGHEKMIPVKDDYVVYSYGEIDIRLNFDKIGESKEVFVNKIIHPYVNQIILNERKHHVKSVVSGFIPPFESKHADIVEYMNKELQKRCLSDDILFFDVYSKLVGPNKTAKDKSIFCKEDPIHLKKEMAPMVYQWFRELLTPPLGFIILTHCQKPVHIENLLVCVKNVRKYHPDDPIVILDDHSGIKLPDFTYDRNIKMEKTKYPKSAEISPLFYYHEHKFCQKLVYLHDTMHLQAKIENADSVENVAFLWHFTNHRHDWATIKEPPTEYNLENKIYCHDDIILHLIHKYMNKEFKKYANGIYYQKYKWVGCFGLMCIITHEFLNDLHKKTQFLSLVPQITDRRRRCAAESIFALACQYSLQKPIISSYDGLYYDAQGFHNNYKSKHFVKIAVCNRCACANCISGKANNCFSV